MNALSGGLTAIVARLRDEVLGVVVYADLAPENVAGPHLVVGESSEVSRSTFTTRGTTNVETVHVWVPARSGLAARIVVEEVIGAMTGEPLDMGPGLETVGARVLNVQMIGEPGWRHGVIRFRMLNRSAVTES